MGEIISAAVEGLKALAVLLGAPSPKAEILDHPNHEGGILTLVKDGYKVQEVKGPMRSVRGHELHDVPSFAALLNRIATPETTEILSDVDSLKIGAYLDPTAANSDALTCRLTKHPIFVLWEEAFGDTADTSQREAQQFVRSVQSTIVGLKGMEVQGKGGAGDYLLQELSKLSMVSGQKVEQKINTLGYTEFTSASGERAIKGSIPPAIEIEIPVFRGVTRPGDEPGAGDALYTVEVNLLMDADGSGVSFGFSCPTLPLVLARAMEDATDQLRAALDEGFLVGLGKLSRRDVVGLQYGG